MRDTVSNLYRIVSSYFVAGIIEKNGVIIYAAPILEYMINWDIEKVIDYSKKKEWSCQIVLEEKQIQ